MTEDRTTQPTVFDDLLIRTVVGFCLALIALLFIWAGGLFLSAFMGILAALMVFELVRMIGPSQNLEEMPRLVLSIGAGLAVFLFGISPLHFTVGASLALLIAATLNQRPLLPMSVLCYASVVLGSAGLLYLRDMRAGFSLTVWIILCVAAADIGGYMFGRVFQGPKLIPAISPKKTWSGFIGGIAMAVVVAIIFSQFSGGDLRTLALLAMIMAVVSVAGDLCVSALKRRVGVKDAGTILPGHGGLMDRFDGMTAVFLLMATMALIGDLGQTAAPGYLASFGAG